MTSGCEQNRANQKILCSEQNVYEYINTLNKVWFGSYGCQLILIHPRLIPVFALCTGCLIEVNIYVSYYLCRAFTNVSPETNGKFPLPISRDLFQYIVQMFDISDSFLAVLSTGLARYISPRQRKKGNDDRTIRRKNSSFALFQWINWPWKSNRVHYPAK